MIPAVDLPPVGLEPEAIPSVCFLEDVCRVLRISLTTAKRLRRHGTFPIPELPALDKRPRFSGAQLAAYIRGEREGRYSSWRRKRA